MLRSVLGFVGGCLAAGIVAGLIQRVGLSLYPPNIDDSTTPSSLKSYLESAPIPALLLILQARTGAALVGAWLALRIGKNPRQKGPAIAVGLMMLIASIPLMFSAPERLWFSVGMVVGIPMATSIPILAGYRHQAAAVHDNSEQSG